MALIASRPLLRSTNTTPAISSSLPTTGTSRISALAMPLKSRRTSFAMISTSARLWWLNTKMQGRFVHRFFSPRHLQVEADQRGPVVAKGSEAKFAASRVEPVSAQIGRLASEAATRVGVGVSART